MPWIADGSRKYRCALCGSKHETRALAYNCELKHMKELGKFSPYDIGLFLRLSHKNPCDFCLNKGATYCGLDDKNECLCLMTAYKLFSPDRPMIREEFE